MKTRLITIRLDDKTRRAVTRIARNRKKSSSSVVRDLIEDLVAREAVPARPYDLWKPYIGLLRGGPPDLSVRTGERVRRLLEERARRRR